MNAPAPKPVIWMGDSLARLQAFPPTVQPDIALMKQRLARAATLHAAQEN
jgi:hypothetical protein